jgi:ankyrin repeat protein
MRHLRLLTEAIPHDAALGIREPGVKNKLLHLGFLLIANSSGKSIDRINILRQLLRAGKMSPNVRDVYGNTPAHIAALEDFLQAAEILVEYKAILEELDRFGRWPLMIASKFEKFRCITGSYRSGDKNCRVQS